MPRWSQRSATDPGSASRRAWNRRGWRSTQAELLEEAAHFRRGVDRAARRAEAEMLEVGRARAPGLASMLSDLPKPEPTVGHQPARPLRTLAAVPSRKRGNAAPDQAAVDPSGFHFSASPFQRARETPQREGASRGQVHRTKIRLQGPLVGSLLVVREGQPRHQPLIDSGSSSEGREWPCAPPATCRARSASRRALLCSWPVPSGQVTRYPSQNCSSSLPTWIWSRFASGARSTFNPFTHTPSPPRSSIQTRPSAR